MEHIFNPTNNVFIDLGPVQWYYYSLMILTGIVIATLLGIKEGNKLGIKTDDIIDGLLIIVPLSIVGTRLWYVIFEFGNIYLPTFKADGFIDGMLHVINIGDGGLAIHGGFITAFISAYFYTKRKGINILSTFDIMVPGFLIAQASGRWGNFFNQEAHGGMIGGVKANGEPALSLDAQREFLSGTLKIPKFITDNMLMAEGEGFMVPNATTENATDMIRAAYYHPTFLYESLWNIVGFIIILIVRRTKWLKNGDLLAFYLVWYGIGRFFIEGMRTDSLYIGDTNIRTAQLISIIMILGAVGYLYVTRGLLKSKFYHEVLAENEEQNINANTEKDL
jgi:phosphatidylglycerol:prolipoprotein diacylglycerol transferase